MNQQAKHSDLAAQIRGAYAGSPIAPIRPQLADLDVDTCPGSIEGRCGRVGTDSCNQLSAALRRPGRGV